MDITNTKRVQTQKFTQEGNIMKLKIMPMLTGAIALTLVAMPLAVNAQTDTFEPLLLSQEQSQGQGRGQGRWAGLNLSNEQKQQLAQIRQQTRAQIEALLTPAQREQFQAARQNNQRRRGVLREMNLSQEQRTQIRAIRESAKSRSQAVLTPEQQEQLRQNMQNIRERRQQRNQ